MQLRDSMLRATPVAAVNPFTLTNANTAQVGAIIDRQGFEGLEFQIIANISDTNATITPLVEDGDAANLSDAAAVADADLLGPDRAASAAAPETQATYAATDDNVVRRIGYIGSKRYVRLTLTPAANDAGTINGAAIARKFSGRHG